MSAPRVWWSPAFPGRIYREYDDGPCRATEYDNPVSDLPADVIPLVPQASRDELRDELAKALCPAPDECYGSPRGHCFRRADRVLDVLAERGLVSSPGDRGGRAMSEHSHDWRFDGDDPYIICRCGEVRDAISGRVITSGAVPPTDKERSQ